MNKPVIGLDVSRGMADFFVSFEPLGVPPRDFYESSEFNSCHHRMPIDSDLVSVLEELNPRVVILEPTGSYSKFLIAALEEKFIPFLLVNQTVVQSTRKAFGGTDNKDDAFDSLLLSHLYWEKHERVFDRRFWVKFRHPLIRRIKTLLLEMRSASKKSGAARASVKQRLIQGEWLSKAKVDSDRPNGRLHPDRLPAFYAWLAGWHCEGGWQLSSQWRSCWDRQHKEAAGRGEATPITEATRSLAKVVCLHHQTEARAEIELLELLRSPLFSPYHQIFDLFGFGQRERAWILVRIYPFEDFLSPEGKILSDYSRGSRRDGKPTKKPRSKRRFKQSLGVGRIQKSSGDSQRSSANTGSSEIRGILWTYVFCRIETGFDRQGKPKPNRFASPVVEEARNYFFLKAFPESPGGQRVKAAGRRIADARNATCRKVAELLFRELAKVFVVPDGGESSGEGE